MPSRRFGVLALLLLAACAPGSPDGAPDLVVSATPPPSLATPALQATGSASPLPTDTPLPPAVNELPGAVLPPGFSLLRYAELGSHPTSLAFDLEGRLLVTSVDSNLRLLLDEDGDGRSDGVRYFASGYYLPLGVTVHPESGDVYLSSQGRITVLRDSDGDLIADQKRTFSDDLPFGLHQNDNLKFGPDGMLYIGVGSTCDACLEADPRSGTILQFDIATRTSRVYARGMRNPYDLAFHPLTGDLFATDNGRDDLGLEAPFEELNHILKGGHYGWPDCWNRFDGPSCTGTTQAIAFFDPHSSANSLDFYPPGPFPEEYHYNLFVAVFGSWLKPGVETGIQRLVLVPDGETYRTEPEWFVRFPPGVMPLGLIVGPDGALYVGDYANDSIYRISYGTP